MLAPGSAILRRCVIVFALCALAAAPAIALTPIQKKCRDKTKYLSHCPDIGCPPDHHPNLDPVKNRTDAATSPTAMTVADVVALNAKIDNAWTADQERTPIEAVGEGRAVAAEGYLVHEKPESAGESCNCYLGGEANNDIHLNLVGTLAETKLDSTTARMKSIVTETTPRVRKNHPGWTGAKLGYLVLHAKRVRLTGWLMLDSSHLHDHHGGPRASYWEVHPITKFEVRSGSTWIKLDTYHP